MRQAIVGIERLGARGEGFAKESPATEGAGGIFVPYALAGETARVNMRGERGELVEILEPSPDRIPAFCPHFQTCGGCAVQNLAPAAYFQWKRGLLVDALANAGLTGEIRACLDAQGAGRRRATFHARYDSKGPRVGFMQARAHELVEIDACPLLVPELRGAPAIALDLARSLKCVGKPLDLGFTATRGGIDADIRGCGPLDAALRRELIALAERHDLARLSNHGEILITRRTPFLRVGRAQLTPPPGGFLQATEAGELALADFILRHADGADKIADLFAGSGAFSLRLAESAQVCAIDSDSLALAALEAARKTAPNLRLRVERRDLFRRALLAEELNAFDCVLFDPPRAGAQAQSAQIAQSEVARVIAISCNPQTFARDAALLAAGGYRLEHATPLDQFRAAAHIEIAAFFTRPKKAGKKRSLLSR